MLSGMKRRMAPRSGGRENKLWEVTVFDRETEKKAQIRKYNGRCVCV